MQQTVKVCDVIVKVKTTCNDFAYQTITVARKRFDICDHHAEVGVKLLLQPTPKIRDLKATINIGKGRVKKEASA